MSINSTLSNIDHPKSILASWKSNKELPFREILSTNTIADNLANLEYRKRVFSPDITLWTFLSQVLDDDQSLQAAVARVIAFYVSQGENAPSANTSAYSQARARLSEEVLINLTRQCAEQLEAGAPATWLFKNRYIKLFDGSTVSMPDTEENQAIYPQSRVQKKGVGFPIARIVTIISYATGAVLDLAIGPCSGKGTGEHALLRQLMHIFKRGDIALGDAYYASFFLLAMLIQLGVDVVFPVHGARDCDFRRGNRLGKKDHIVEWKKPRKPMWMEQNMYDSFPVKITVREVSIQNHQKGFRTKKRVIVTTFLDPISMNRQCLSELYDYRWCIELDLRSIKETMRMGILRGKTPEMVRKEIWAHLLVYNLVRKIMAQSAIVNDKIPRELSFKLALQMIAAFRQIGILLENNRVVYLELLKAIAYKRIGNRAGRREPRRVKRSRPKPFPRLQKPRSFYKDAA